MVLNIKIYPVRVPCVYELSGGMFPGRIIRVQGIASLGVTRFSINLSCGPNQYPLEDIALHLNFRYDQMSMVLNHYTAIDAKWGVEEIIEGMPFKQGDPFECLIECKPLCLKIALNGKYFCDFAHRIPFKRISHLAVNGDVIVQLIGFEGAQPEPTLKVPYVCSLAVPDGMFPGRMIRVQGSTAPYSQRFSINLTCGPNEYPLEDNAFHLNFRYDQMAVVLNHFTAIERKWGVEEIIKGVPIKQGDPFECLIECEPLCLKIALNGKHFCEFAHRIPFKRISHLSVEHDVMVQLISFEGAQPPQEQMCY